MGGRRSSRSWPAASARTRPRGSSADTTRPSKTSCATSSRPPLSGQNPDRPPGPEESEVDETAAEGLFASLLVEIHPPPPGETAGGHPAPDVEETRPPSAAPGDREGTPVTATPAETEGR